MTPVPISGHILGLALAIGKVKRIRRRVFLKLACNLVFYVT